VTATKNKYYPVAIVEVLILQRFPYGNDSTFFYFATGKTLDIAEGDVLKVPWRKGEKIGVAVKTKRLIVNHLPENQWKININSIVKNKSYFFADAPDKPINLKPISSILEKQYFSSDLLLRLRASAKEYFVSWNHFAKYVADLLSKKTIRRVSSKKTYLTLLSKWIKANKSAFLPETAQVLKKINHVSEKFNSGGKNSLVFVSYEQIGLLTAIIKKTIQERKQILILVPEKSQLIPIAAKYTALTKSFAIATPMLLGKFLPRVLFRNAWQMTRCDAPHIFVGTRSSIFAPFLNLGLIVIEEGHDSSHKQWDLSPLYDVRKLVLLLYPETLKIYLSGTPRLQDFFSSPFYLKAGNKSLQIMTLNFNLISKQRPKQPLSSAEDKPPHILTRSIQFGKEKKKVILVNMRTENKLAGKALPISRYLKRNLVTELRKGKSALLLANHKGIANLIMCQDCGYVSRCPNCGKALSFENSNNLHCNFCGFRQPLLQKCPQCSSFKFVYKNFGIETIKENLKDISKKVNFSLVVPPDPSAPNSKWWEFTEDLITKSKKPAIYLGYAGLIPIGKTLSAKIGLAGFLSFDEALFNPDYCSFEKTASRFYNLMSLSPKIYVQTFNPLQPFLQKIIHNPYSLLFSEWLEERKNFSYPPYAKMYVIDVPNSKFSNANQIAARIVRQLARERDIIDSVITPVKSSSERNKYGASILVKAKAGSTNINLIISSLFKNFGNLRIDPDPYA